MEEAHELQGHSVFYKYFAVYPEIGRFRRFGSYWAKKIHDDTSELQACIRILNEQLKKYPELGGMTVLDCPRALIKKVCPEDDDRFRELWEALRNYEKSLREHGMFV